MCNNEIVSDTYIDLCVRYCTLPFKFLRCLHVRLGVALVAGSKFALLIAHHRYDPWLVVGDPGEEINKANETQNMAKIIPIFHEVSIFGEAKLV